MAKHTDATVGNVHIIYNWTYADMAAREAATGLVAGDVGKFCRQLDDNSIWMLTDDDPVTWAAMAGAPFIHTHVEADITDLDHTDTDAFHVSVVDEIDALDEKVTPVDADLLLIEDSEDAGAKKKVQISNLPGGAGGGDSTYTDVYASRPAAGNDGDLFLPADGFTVQRDTGAAWVPWGPIFPFIKPVLTDFAWINQGAATAVDAKGGIYFLTPAVSGDNFRILKKAAPATPYTITACFLSLRFPVNYAFMGLVFRQSSDGKFQTFGAGYANKTIYQSYKYNSVTSGSAEYFQTPKLHQYLTWLQISDDGTNRICRISVDGQNWIQLHTIGRTDFLTADEVGVFINSNNATYPAAMVLLHWKAG